MFFRRGLQTQKTSCSLLLSNKSIIESIYVYVVFTFVQQHQQLQQAIIEDSKQKKPKEKQRASREQNTTKQTNKQQKNVTFNN